mgnify:CR=1 FL=1
MRRLTLCEIGQNHHSAIVILDKPYRCCFGQNHYSPIVILENWDGVSAYMRRLTLCEIGEIGEILILLE